MSKDGVRVRFEMTDWVGHFTYAEYSYFRVGDEASKYKLNIGGHSGPLCDSMIARHNNMLFSTKGLSCMYAWMYLHCTM